jgi:sugar/nucleoside kinase (ribokinase family)
MKTFELDHNRDVIAGIGNALVDILLHEDDAFVAQTGYAKGGMNYVPSNFADKMLALSSNKPEVVPGGSACNTIVGIGKLGGGARFVGKCGKDTMGELFERELRHSDVDPHLMTSPQPTGRALSVVTPDAQRSMFTYLGAAAEMTADEIAQCRFNDAAIVHIEGYLLFNNDLIVSALKRAQTDGARISLDLASYTVVASSKSELDTLVDEYVDILIANEDEAAAFTGYHEEPKALAALAERAGIAALKVGKRGSYIAHNNTITEIKPAGQGPALDTTGAGDLWASGFLYGLVQGCSIEKCGQLASACGYEVCRILGASIPDSGWSRIKRIVEE